MITALISIFGGFLVGFGCATLLCINRASEAQKEADARVQKMQRRLMERDRATQAAQEAMLNATVGSITKNIVFNQMWSAHGLEPKGYGNAD